ncbi:MAG: division/cell wall cluster transcriptional repressor MraZ [Candidatus Dojkabacteria bacterium]
MVSGQYKVQVGDKNRLAIPKKIRDELDGCVYLTRGFDRSLILFDDKMFDSFIREIDKGNYLNSEFRELKRYFVGGMVQIEYDIQGRFVLNESLKNFASIGDTVYFIGINNWIEIWDSEIWIEREKKMIRNLNKISQDFLNSLNK